MILKYKIDFFFLIFLKMCTNPVNCAPSGAILVAGRKEDPALGAAGLIPGAPPAPESAWERGLRQAKEILKKSTKRKETEVS